MSDTKFEPGKMLFLLEVKSPAKWRMWKNNGWADDYVATEEKIVRAFFAEVCRIAEGNMLKTGKLEGSHYAAMQQVLETYQ